MDADLSNGITSASIGPSRDVQIFRHLLQRSTDIGQRPKFGRYPSQFKIFVKDHLKFMSLVAPRTQTNANGNYSSSRGDSKVVPWTKKLSRERPMGRASLQAVRPSKVHRSQREGEGLCVEDEEMKLHNDTHKTRKSIHLLHSNLGLWRVIFLINLCTIHFLFFNFI